MLCNGNYLFLNGHHSGILFGNSFTLNFPISKAAYKAVEAFIDTLMDYLSEGEKVMFKGFGRFEMRTAIYTQLSYIVNPVYMVTIENLFTIIICLHKFTFTTINHLIQIV